MKRQKRTILINDITGFGRCSIAAMLPILSAMKIQTSFIPTAILSTNTYFKNHYMTDYTQDMEKYIKTYKELDLCFDSICSGFLGSSKQIDILIDFMKHFKKNDTFVLVDPVMGDQGQTYPHITKEMCSKIRDLLKYADIITPNLTEISILLERPLSNNSSFEELNEMCQETSKLGPKKIVITGIPQEKNILNFIYEKDKEPQILATPKIGIDRSGTGDVFSAIIIGNYMHGTPFYQCVEKAISFVSKCISYADALDLPFNHGLCFEEFLTEL